MSKPLTYGDLRPALTRYWAGRFERAATELQPHPDVDPILEQAMRDSYRSQAEDLRAEADAFAHGIGITRDGQRVDPRDFYAQPEQDPMSITLRIEEIANGWLIHTSDQETAYIGSPSAIGLKFHPDADAVRRALPQAFDDAVAEAKAREARYADERRACLNQIPRYGEDSTTAPSKSIHAYGNPGFVIGGERFVDEPTSEAGPEPHTSR